MQEVEVKARIKDPRTIKEKLAQLGCIWSLPMVQDDRIFLPSSFHLNNLPSDRVILRLRQQNDESIFTLKKHGKNELDSYEREVKVSDGRALSDILICLGFEEKAQLHIHKVRQKTHYQDMEICLDQVDHLGSFIEVEKLVSAGNSEVIQNKLFQFLESLGVYKEDRVFVGYDTLMRQWHESKGK